MNEALNRKNLYALLASIFLPVPDHIFTQNVLRLNLKAEVYRFYEDNSDISLGVNLIQNYIALNRALPVDKVQAELAVDKTRLITKAPHGVRGGVQSFGQGAGMVASEDMPGSPDYMRRELNLMAELCTEEALILSHGHSPDTIFECAVIRLLQKEFLQNHIHNWAPSLAAELISDAATDFFKGIGFLLKGYIHLEGNRLGLDWNIRTSQ